MDYADVLISLAEERYFEPIYEVKKNDSLVGILLSPPYQLDITPYMKEGNNKMEILVYSTLANHYQTIPTPYRGDPKAGLLEPVNLLIE